MLKENIRNFSIIAHIDHGKSTLADRILEHTKSLTQRELQEQFLDKMDIEKERGITIKAQTVRIHYKAKDGIIYQLQLIDTPGHVDFNYEVSRSLAACEGALLVVDATQGVEAQTLANVYLALENNLEIVPVLNKIDLDSADVEGVKKEIEDIIGLDASEAVSVSAKTGVGVEDVLESIVKNVPAPTRGDVEKPLRALVYDSWFDSYLGVMVQIRIFDGKVKKGDKIKFIYTDAEYEVYKVGVFTPHAAELPELSSGDVGYLSASIKQLKDIKIGDTITLAKAEVEPLDGFKQVKPMVFGGLYPVDAADYEDLRAALDKLSLNDGSFTFEPETSAALGFGFRCGYLGLLHMEIIQERLEREFELDLITTAPSTVYRIVKNNGEVVEVDTPTKMPEPEEIDYIEEPIVTVTLHSPKEYVGSLIKICEDKRGRQQGIDFHSETRAVIVYEIPLSEVILDFHDKVKSRTRGYASFDYEIKDYQRDNLVKLDIRINSENVDALSVIVHRDQAQSKGRDLTEKLKELIDRQMFDVAIQAAIGGKILARTNVKALRKNVTAKCYGGDISRKRKLLEKQKKGKKRMKNVGSVEIPQEAFLAVLKLGDD